LSKKNAEIHVVFSDGVQSTHVLSVVLQRDELYTITHATPLEGKHSRHASGRTHHDVGLIQRRVRGDVRGRTRDLKNYELVTGVGGGDPPGLGDYRVKGDTPRRRSLVLPRPVNQPWGIMVWMIEHAKSKLAAQIAETAPFPRSKVTAAATADWSDPIV
jgi:hypothetical protein